MELRPYLFSPSRCWKEQNCLCFHTLISYYALPMANFTSTTTFLWSCRVVFFKVWSKSCLHQILCNDLLKTHIWGLLPDLLSQGILIFCLSWAAGVGNCCFCHRRTPRCQIQWSCCGPHSPWRLCSTWECLFYSWNSSLCYHSSATCRTTPCVSSYFSKFKM